MSRVFVTGATGFLGSNLVRRLVEEGEEVHALIYPGTWHPFLDGLDIKRFEGDVLDRESLRPAMFGCQEVYHTAGLVSYFRRDFDRMMRVHYEGTRNVMGIALTLGVSRVVHTSSCAAVGLPDSEFFPQDENASWDKRHNKVGYMISKKASEAEALKANENGLEVVVVNPTSFFGEGDVNMNEGELFKNLKRGKLKAAPPGGNSVVAIDDVVDGHLLAMGKGIAGERYILSNEFLPFIDLFNIIAEELGVQIVERKLPRISFYGLYPLAFLAESLGARLPAQAIAFSFKYRYYDSSKARRELGWQPKVDFREAVRKAISFYEEHGLI